MSLKSRIEALILQISNAKTSLGDALRNKGVDPGSNPSFEALRLGIERISSGDKYKELIGKGSIFSTNLETNKTSRQMVMAPDKSSFSLKINCQISSTSEAINEINGSFYKGDLVAIAVFARLKGNYGLTLYNISQDLFVYFNDENSDGLTGYPWVENVLFLESVTIAPINTNQYNFSFTGYALKVGKSPVD